MANPYVPQIDYSFIGQLPDVYEQGKARTRQYQTREALATEEARKALEAGDFGTLARIVSPIDQELGASFLKQGFGGSNNPYGANLYYGTEPDPANPGKRRYVLMAPDKQNAGLIRANPPEGVQIEPPTYNVPGPTSNQLVARPGGAVVAEMPKDVMAAAGQRERGKREIELEYTFPKVEAAFGQIKAKWGGIKNVIAEADSLVSPASTGLVGAASANIPTSPAYKLQQKIKQIQAYLAFKELGDMRQASPTGSGLGQISNYEDQLLSLINGSLAPGVDEETIRKNLKEIIRIQGEMEQIQEREFANTYGFGHGQRPPPGYWEQRQANPAMQPQAQPGVQPDPNANLQPNELPISPTPVAPPQPQAPAAPGGVIDYNDYFR